MFKLFVENLKLLKIGFILYKNSEKAFFIQAKKKLIFYFNAWNFISELKLTKLVSFSFKFKNFIFLKIFFFQVSKIVQKAAPKKKNFF